MAYPGSTDGLRKSILKTIKKIKTTSKEQRKRLLLISSICIVLFTVILAFNSKTGNNGGNRLVSTIKVDNVIENNTSDNGTSTKQGRELNGISDIRDNVNEILRVKILTYVLRVDGEDLAVFKTKNEAQQLLDDVVKPFIGDEAAEVEDVSFKENVKIVEKLIDVNEFSENPKYEELFYYITKGTNETKIHKVEKGENYWVIAKEYNVEVDSLVKANPDIKPEKIQIGQEISLVVPKPMITVITQEIEEYTEYIAYETEYEDTGVLYKGEHRVKKEGKKGEREIKAKVSRENGIEMARNILEENIILEPTTKIVLKGTKNPPPRIGTGKFAKPTSRGSITSPFGMRWGRRHTGIDIGIPTGTSVTAADGGKVVFSGYKGGYGKCLIVDHGANMKTLYAHNSKLVVKNGDKVFKGQTIAKSGNTGRSTGPHLHFEVRINDIPVNPIKYVKY